MHTAAAPAPPLASLAPLAPLDASQGSRLGPIDVWRGAAISLVLLLHFHLGYHLDQSALVRIMPAAWIKRVANNGNYGVTIFFVISGYLITSRALQRYGALDRVNVREFYVMRFARLAPALALMLTLVVALSYSPLAIFQQRTDKASLLISVLSVLTFTHNVLMAKAGYFNYCLNILWSLSVEEVYYLTFPWLGRILRRPAAVYALWVALIVIAPVYRWLHADDEIRSFYGYLACFDALALGCFAGCFAGRLASGAAGDGWKGPSWPAWVAKRRGTAWPSLVAGLRAVAIAGVAGVYIYARIGSNVVFGFSLIAIGTSAYLLALPVGLRRLGGAGDLGDAGADRRLAGSARIRAGSARLLGGAARGFAWLGRHCYELYLFHVVILGLMRTIAPPGSLGPVAVLGWLGLYLGLACLAASGAAQGVTAPFNRWIRARFAPGTPRLERPAGAVGLRQSPAD